MLSLLSEFTLRNQPFHQTPIASSSYNTARDPIPRGKQLIDLQHLGYPTKSQK